MKTNHTEGPWTVGRTITGNAEACEFVGENSDGEKRFNAMVQGPDYFVAGVGGIGRAECLANARLISAAPDLLAALEALLEEADMGEVCEETRPIIEQAQRAIAKARGEA